METEIAIAVVATFLGTAIGAVVGRVVGVIAWRVLRGGE